MLTEGQRQLLTAYVDGELNEPQQQQVQSLLEESSEARRLLDQLERDAVALRRLNAPSLDRDLAGRVLETIARCRLVPQRRRVLSRLAPYPAWAGLATAAAVLFLVGGVAYLYFSAAFLADQGPPIVANNPLPDKTPGVLARDLPRPEIAAEKALPEPPTRPVPPPQPERPPQTPQVAEKPREKPNATPEKAPVTPPDIISTAPSMEKFELKMVTLQPPTVLSLRDLDQDPAKTRLLEELSKDSITRIELPCRNASRAFERLQAAGKERHFALLVDSFTQGRLKVPHLRTHYAFFAEDLTPEEVAHLLLQIGAEDRKYAGKRPTDAHFDRVVIGRLSKLERKDLADLLGFDPDQPPSARSKGPLGTDPSRPLSELTAAQVSKSLAGQGASRPEPGKPAAKTPERNALVAAFGASRPRTTPTAGKSFQELRKPARQGTVQIFLVLRHTGI